LRSLWRIVLVLDSIAHSTLHPDDRETIAEMPLRHGFDSDGAVIFPVNAQRPRRYIPFTSALRSGN